MQVSDVRRIQTKLVELGDYPGPIDGERGPDTNKALRTALPKLKVALPPDWPGYSDKRIAVLFLQAWSTSLGIPVGILDGWWGPNTANAASSLAEKLATGSVEAWRDVVPSSVNPNGWPTEAGVPNFYGPHGNPNGSRPPPPLVKVASPWTFRIAWNLSQHRTFLWAHEKTAASLARVLGRIHQRYGDSEIKRLRLDIFSGDYDPRLMRGSATKWSMHAWGIAYDFDDTNNQLKWGSDRAFLARPDYKNFWEIWEAEGWVSLGRTENRDWMHVQAARK